jgi:hypothetical protein
MPSRGQNLLPIVFLAVAVWIGFSRFMPQLAVDLPLSAGGLGLHRLLYVVAVLSFWSLLYDGFSAQRVLLFVPAGLASLYFTTLLDSAVRRFDSNAPHEWVRLYVVSASACLLAVFLWIAISPFYGSLERVRGEYLRTLRHILRTATAVVGVLVVWTILWMYAWERGFFPGLSFRPLNAVLSDSVFLLYFFLVFRFSSPLFFLKADRSTGGATSRG